MLSDECVMENIETFLDSWLLFDSPMKLKKRYLYIGKQLCIFIDKIPYHTVMDRQFRRKFEIPSAKKHFWNVNLTFGKCFHSTEPKKILFRRQIFQQQKNLVETEKKGFFIGSSQKTNGVILSLSIKKQHRVFS